MKGIALKELEELNRLGYSLEIDSNKNIKYYFQRKVIQDCDKKRAGELFRYIKKHKTEAVVYITAHPELAFVELFDNILLPWQEVDTQ